MAYTYILHEDLSLCAREYIQLYMRGRCGINLQEFICSRTQEVWYGLYVRDLVLPPVLPNARRQQKHIICWIRKPQFLRLKVREYIWAKCVMLGVHAVCKSGFEWCVCVSFAAALYMCLYLQTISINQDKCQVHRIIVVSWYAKYICVFASLHSSIFKPVKSS